MLSTIIHSTLGYPTFTMDMITGTLEVSFPISYDFYSYKLELAFAPAHM